MSNKAGTYPRSPRKTTGIGYINGEPTFSNTTLTAKEALLEVLFASKTDPDDHSRHVRTQSLSSATTTLVGEDDSMPDWMLSINLDAISVTPVSSAWKEIGGFIERNGHCVGMTEAVHNAAVSEIEDEHAEKIAEISCAHEEEVRTLENAVKREATRARVAERARATGKKKITTQQQRIDQLRQDKEEKDNTIAELHDRFCLLNKEKMNLGQQNKELERDKKQLQRDKQHLERDHHAASIKIQEQEAELEQNETFMRNREQKLISLQQLLQILESPKCDTIDGYRRRAVEAEQEVSRLAAKDMECKHLELNNRIQARRVRDLLDKRAPIEEELANIQGMNKLILARNQDIETQLAGQQRFVQDTLNSVSPNFQQLLEENQRLINRSEEYRRAINDLSNKASEQAKKIDQLNEENDKLDWGYFTYASDKIELQEELTKVGNAARKVPQLENMIYQLNIQLSQPMSWFSPGSAPRDNQLLRQQLYWTNQQIDALRKEKNAFEALAVERLNCEKEVARATGECDLAWSVNSSLHKQLNHYVREYDRLRKQAGLEAQAPSAGAVGLTKIFLRAEFEKMAATHGYHLSEEQLLKLEAQDSIILNGTLGEENNDEGFDEAKDALGRELSSFERIVPNVIDNVGKILQSIYNDRPMPSMLDLHPTNRYLEDEGLVMSDNDGSNVEYSEGGSVEKGFNPRRALFADTTSLLDEVRHEARFSSGSSFFTACQNSHVEENS